MQQVRCDYILIAQSLSITLKLESLSIRFQHKIIVNHRSQGQEYQNQASLYIHNNICVGNVVAVSTSYSDIISWIKFCYLLVHRCCRGCRIIHLCDTTRIGTLHYGYEMWNQGKTDCVIHIWWRF